MKRLSLGSCCGARLFLLTVILPILALGGSGCSAVAPSFEQAHRSPDQEGGASHSQASIEKGQETASLGSVGSSNRSANLLAQNRKPTTDASGVDPKSRSVDTTPSKTHSDSIKHIADMPAWMDKTSPVMGSPQWKREEKETARREHEITKEINGICHGC